ncbi:MAG: hypothetical protein ACFFD6_05350 [Candidatus Thorarchaeota archaeon]
MRLPGTNIDVLISSNIIEIRDEGFLKSVEYAGRRYEDVLDEVQRIMYKRGWDITKRVIRYVLETLGLPEVDYFPEAELSKEEAADMRDMLDSLRDLTDTFLSPKGNVGAAVSEDEATEPSESKEGELKFSFNPQNIPKETPAKQSRSESDESGFDWEAAPEVGSQ